MTVISRRRFLQLSAMTGGALLFSNVTDLLLRAPHQRLAVHAAEPIKIGILDPLSSPYKTSSIHDVHGANVAVDLFNKSGGILGRPVVILEADDASNPQTAIKAVAKFVKDDRVDILMGTLLSVKLMG
jgi:branched-chain amino acid transport system substrate-binding protein